MDIHKPKPWHGFREFLKEYLIIVVGVLTALGAEQVAERLHNRHSAREASENIRAEIQSNITSLTVRKGLEPCVGRRLDEISAALSDPMLFGNGPIWVGHPFVAALAEGQLHIAEQAGHASLLPREEQARYADIYALFSQFRDAQDVEMRAWADLRALEQRPALTPVADWQLRSALQQARAARWSMQVAADLAMQGAAKSGIRPLPVKPWPMQSACLPFHNSRADALAKVVAGRPSGRVYDEP